MVVARLATMPMGGNQHTEGSESLLTQGDAARMLSVSDRIRTATQVQEKGAPELVHAVESGKVSVSAAAVIAKQDGDAQRRVAAEDKRKRGFKLMHINIVRPV